MTAKKCDICGTLYEQQCTPDVRVNIYIHPHCDEWVDIYALSARSSSKDMSAFAGKRKREKTEMDKRQIINEELKKYTINLYDLLYALIYHGQYNDDRFEPGDLMKYDPVSVVKIAKEYIMSDKWIEYRPNEWTYELKCPVCGYRYSPSASVDGTISSSEIFAICPKCGKKLKDPAEDKRW